ncbi:MAG TPA: hypothetical protein VFF69_04310 [Phycisphaerales bacterium]|nr:hypothetical protein [Phycisphaerales bacterium]
MDWRAGTLILVTRLVGLGLLIAAIEVTTLWIRDILTGVLYVQGSTWRSVAYAGLERVHGPLMLLLGAYLVLGGRGILRRMLRGLDGGCPACGHPWPDAGAARCPECGFGAMVVRRTIAPEVKAAKAPPEEGLP